MCINRHKEHVTFFIYFGSKTGWWYMTSMQILSFSYFRLLRNLHDHNFPTNHRYVRHILRYLISTPLWIISYQKTNATWRDRGKGYLNLPTPLPPILGVKDVKITKILQKIRSANPEGPWTTTFRDPYGPLETLFTDS